MLAFFPFKLFSLIWVVFPIFFFIIFGIIGFSLIGNVGKRAFNAKEPVLTVAARVLSKRTDMSGSSNGIYRNLYYVTFEVESGDRMEFKVSGEQYGMLVEEDMGKLTFQGTRYMDFQRVN
ncbi:MAG: DUF2500 domain-containing protein [Tissierellaceae bacterium]